MSPKEEVYENEENDETKEIEDEENLNEENIEKEIEYKINASQESIKKTKGKKKLKIFIKKNKRIIALIVALISLAVLICIASLLFKFTEKDEKASLYKPPKSKTFSKKDDKSDINIDETAYKSLVGTWKLESQENFDEFLEDMGNKSAN